MAALTLRQGGFEPHYQRVETEEEFRRALALRKWDIILLDYALRAFSGSRALRLCQELGCEAPVIVVSASVGEDVAVQMMKEGAADYVRNDHIEGLPAAVRRSIAEAHARSERRIAREELRASRDWLSAILHSVGEGVIAVDAETCIRFMNRVAEELTGFTEEEALGKRAGEVIRLAAENGEQLDDLASELAIGRQRTGVGQDYFLRRKNGRLISVVVTASQIRDEQGATAGGVIALRDISERKRAEEQLRHANQELSQFMHSVSHDLQEPLRMISSYAGLIQRRIAGSDADTDEFLRYMLDGAQRMSDLLSDLRTYADLSKVDSAAAESTDAEIVLQGVFVNLASAIEESGAAIAHDPLPVLPVHRSHLTQLFQNLISNAIKYRGQEPPAIRISAGRINSQWRFTFCDNGIGIPKEHKERVFEFFRRLHGSEVPGTGMGLAICRRIVQRYGGRIWLESRVGAGTTFYFTLPA